MMPFRPVPIRPITAMASAQWKRRVGRSQTRVAVPVPKAVRGAATEESVIEGGAEGAMLRKAQISKVRTLIRFGLLL
ncbi:Uncharacterised protein [Mycobacterium tuberculosis]|nr:Uncharacterised protein [Mycobacterium tuberculosis]